MRKAVDKQPAASPLGLGQPKDAEDLGAEDIERPLVVALAEENHLVGGTMALLPPVMR